MSHETPGLPHEHGSPAGSSGVPASARPSWRSVSTALAPLALLLAVILAGVPLCPMHTLLGIPCPGCGLTRATLAALTGHFGDALHFHPLVFVVAPLVIFSIVRSSLVSAKLLRPDAWTFRAPPWSFVLLATLLFGVWIARLAGLLGGPSDPIDPAHGLVGRGVHLITTFF